MEDNIVVKRPVRDGNITDPDALERITDNIFRDFRLDPKGQPTLKEQVEPLTEE